MSAVTPPSATPRPARSGPGCLVSLILLVVVVVAGVVIGTALNKEDDPDTGERAVTVSDGVIDGSEWRVDAVRDVDDAVCAFLYVGDEQVTGSCDDTPQFAPVGNKTIVFGRDAEAAGAARVLLDGGDAIDIAVQEVDGFAERFYVTEVEGDRRVISSAEADQTPG